MRLLYVKAVLERENNVQKVGPKSEVLRELDDRTVHYAILSHRWGSEVSYEELIGLMAMGEQDRAEVRSRDGYQKIIRSCERAMQDGYTWLWIDTCCIDKRSSAELSEAINSMYRWYQNSQKCYAYLNDVEESTFPPERNDSKFGRSNGWPEWFERGWTLQELIAPKRIEFFNKNWVSIGSKASLADMLQKVTHIPREVLLNTPTEQRPCIAQIMSWAADRKTTRVEDRAYSLMGLFGVNMPMLYGEGQKAFQRLQLEIIRASSDHTIFAWDPFGRIRRPGNILADDPSYFRGCHRIKQVEPAHFVFDLTRYIRQHELSNHWFNNVTRRHRLASWHDIVHGQQYRTISITNTGVQVWLPVIPYHGSLSTVKAVVASHQMELVTIDLAFYRSAFERSFDPTGIYKTYPEFKALCLAYTDETRHDLKLDDTNASYHGFTRCGTFPREITGDTVTLLSHVSDLIVVVYTNSDARSRFAVGLGYYSDLGWVHVACDESSTNQEETGTPWADFAKKAYDMMWGARAHHAQQGTPAHGYNGNSIKHAHFPRSIWAARVAWGRWNTGNSTVVVDVEQCPGCCLGPIARTDTTNDRDGLDMPGLMMITLPSHRLLLDGRSVWLHECSRGTSLGDYGDCIGGNFTRHGNIFEDMRTLGIDPENPAYHPVVNRFSSTSDEEFAATIISRSDDSMLSRPIGLSLPSSRHFVLLLKALSTHLSDKHLVITNVQYSHHGWETRIGSNEDSKMDNGSRSTKPGDFTTLCSVASPQVWRRQLACVQRRKRFREIREHFYALVNPLRPGETESHPEPTNGQIDKAIEFFSKAFGLKYLKNYVGEITSLKEFPLKLETKSRRDGPRGIVQRNGLLARPSKSFISWTTKCNPFQDRHQPEAALDMVLGVELRPLLKRCQSSGRAAESRKTKNDVKAISQTLSIGLLEHIGAAFACPDLQNGQGTNEVGYDRQVNAHSVVQEIKELQAELDATKDEDEQRALEEDVTGKILWLFWCVICSEVDQLLPKIVNYIERESNLMGLWEIGEIIRGTFRTDPDDDQVHLRRIMADAGAGTSKHQLWLAARAAQLMNRSGVTAAEDQFNLDTPTAFPRTSHQMPSASLASIP